MRRARHTENRIVDVVAIGATTGIAVKAWWQHFQRQSSRDKLRMVAQALHNKIANLYRQRVILGQLLISLGLDRLMARCQPTILPTGLFKGLTALTHLLGRQHIGNAQHHDLLSSPVALSARNHQLQMILNSGAALCQRRTPGPLIQPNKLSRCHWPTGWDTA